MKRRGFNMDNNWIIFYSKKLHYNISVRYRETRDVRGEVVVYLRLEQTLVPVP
jgi:hypothetical protein